MLRMKSRARNLSSRRRKGRNRIEGRGRRMEEGQIGAETERIGAGFARRRLAGAMEKRTLTRRCSRKRRQTSGCCKRCFLRRRDGAGQRMADKGGSTENRGRKRDESGATVGTTRGLAVAIEKRLPT